MFISARLLFCPSQRCDGKKILSGSRLPLEDGSKKHFNARLPLEIFFRKRSENCPPLENAFRKRFFPVFHWKIFKKSFQKLSSIGSFLSETFQRFSSIGKCLLKTVGKLFSIGRRCADLCGRFSGMAIFVTEILFLLTLI
jgi:hypothetical protein